MSDAYDELEKRLKALPRGEYLEVKVSGNNRPDLNRIRRITRFFDHFQCSYSRRNSPAYAPSCFATELHALEELIDEMRSYDRASGLSLEFPSVVGPQFEVGDRVKAFGVEGTVVETGHYVLVDFGSQDKIAFTVDGKVGSFVKEPSLELVSKARKKKKVKGFIAAYSPTGSDFPVLITNLHETRETAAELAGQNGLVQEIEVEVYE